MSGRLTKCRDDFSETEVDEEIVVMNLASGEFFSLAGTARTIWTLLDAHQQEPALVAALARQYGVGEAEIAPDVRDFVESLVASGLVTAD